MNNPDARSLASVDRVSPTPMTGSTASTIRGGHYVVNAKGVIFRA